MKFHPILFSTEMVEAILEGRKTQTRRIIKPQPGPNAEFCRYDVIGQPLFTDNTSVPVKWQKGGVLWVRETFKPSVFAGAPVGGFEYMADHVKWPDSIGEKYVKGSGLEKGEHWRPSTCPNPPAASSCR